MKRGFQVPFHCERTLARVEPTGTVVEQNGKRFQRIRVVQRRRDVRFLWVPVAATRFDVGDMLEAEAAGDKQYGLPIVESLTQ